MKKESTKKEILDKVKDLITEEEDEDKVALN